MNHVLFMDTDLVDGGGDKKCQHPFMSIWNHKPIRWGFILLDGNKADMGNLALINTSKVASVSKGYGFEHT
jgi:hypothetical protein